MAEYHYKYNPSGGQKNKKKNSDDEWWQWLIIVILLGAFTPLGIFLLIAKIVSSLSTAGRSSTQNRSQATGQASYSYNYSKVRSAAQEAAQGVRTAAQEVAQEVKSATQNATQKTKTTTTTKHNAAKTEPMPGTMAQKPVNPRAGRGFLIAGGITAGVFGTALLIELSSFIGDWIAGHFWSYMISELFSIGAFMGVGLVLLTVGLRRRKQAKNFRKYLGLIGMKKKVSISTLAKATRRKYDKVCDDLQNMLDQGILPVGYLDLENDKLVLTTDGIEDEAEEPEEETVQEEERKDDSILGEIRAVNDSIPDPVMTAKIARIEEITGKILDYQRRYPAKAGQLRNFLNYYLPTTLKILRAYAQLQEQGIEGENISAAKARIEGMMDKVVEGFEKQLDKLFQNDALDITSDVAVLEKMLDNDGLGDSGMTLGGH